MKTKRLLIWFLALFPLALPAAEANRLHFRASGFSIAPLEETPGESTRQAMIMLLPPSDNFAPNVNVQIQPFSGTIDEYVALTDKQFKDAGMKVIAQKKAGKSGATFEYSGQTQGKAVHWYSRAEKSGNHVYLATATSTEAQWPKVGPQLKACIDSLRCDGRE